MAQENWKFLVFVSCYVGLLLCQGASATAYSIFSTVYTFEVPEGILLQPTIIANITLTKWNASDLILFDEVHFSKPDNRKSEPRPCHFSMTFLNVSSIQNNTSIASRARRDIMSQDGSGSNVITSPVATTSPSSEVGLKSTKNPFDDQSTTDVSSTINSSPTTSSTLNVSFSTIPSSPASTLAPSTIVTEALGNITTKPVVTSYMTSQVTKDANSSITAIPITHSTVEYSSTAKTTRAATSKPVTSAEVTTTDLTPGVQEVIAQLSQIYDLDREEKDTHYLTINTYSEGMMVDFPKLIVIKVTDINDNAPVFVKESLHSEVSKDIKSGQVVGEVKATDADTGKNADIQYQLLSHTEKMDGADSSPIFPTFSIDEKYGLIILMNSIEGMDVPTKITFNVVAKDRGSSASGNRATATVTINIIDPDAQPSSTPSKNTVSQATIIALSVVGGLLLIIVLAVVIVRRRRKATSRGDGTLSFMLDDDNLLPA